MNNTSPPPLTNCHTHIFTGDYVPPFLGKCYLPLGLWWVLRTPLIIGLFRFWYYNSWSPYKIKFKLSWIKREFERFLNWIATHFIAKRVHSLLTFYVYLVVFFILDDWLKFTATSIDIVNDIVTLIRVVVPPLGTKEKIFLVVFLSLSFRSVRNFMFFVLRLFKGISLLPGKQTQLYLTRYINLGRFAFYHEQAEIYKQLVAQYSPDSRFVVLPMDMEFMGAGTPRKTYLAQLAELAELKTKPSGKNMLPFIFVDPRRIKADPTFFQYSLNQNNEVVLENCVVKRCIEEEGFVGFKIYPALGYYPFEEELLPLWKYAIQKELPIITHCIKGTIFYRGDKEPEWCYHPVFKESVNGNLQPLMLPQIKNQDFTINFTHPLNYLCLLKSSFLCELVASAKDERIRKLFGYSKDIPRLNIDLSALKLCFGHYGGEDEWTKFLESDRDQYSKALNKYPNGINFMYSPSAKKFSHDKLAQLWKYTDWYSIISSIMLQHPNVYSDISYIIHDSSIWPLLKDAMDRELLPSETRRLSKGILFGTDFYVVRNHKSEKQLLAEFKNNLSKADVDKLTRQNPAQLIQP